MKRNLLVAFAAVIVGAAPLRSAVPAQDTGASGAWQKLLKLTTTASAMHTTAHPDDEHGGMLALLSRRDGVRLSLMTLNRGESGDNAIGSELFDSLGLIRTEELLDADRYYGVDRQYFTTVIDYGFSKRLDEALDKWGRENVLRDVVRIIRMDRPLVLISRFQGNQRDGHGNHQTAGLVTVEAFKAAGDPKMFPEQLAEGLRAWQPSKVYIGGARENEEWNVRVDAGEYSPWLGDSYNNFAAIGLSFQRSQNSGRVRSVPGPSYGYYKRVGSVIEVPAKEASFFDGIDTTITGLFKGLRKPEPSGARDVLGRIDAAVKEAVAAFKLTDPSAAVPALARGLAATRAAIAQLSSEPDAAFALKVKEQQFDDAINVALGIEFNAVAQPSGLPEPSGPGAAFTAAATMAEIIPSEIALETGPGWQVQEGTGSIAPITYNQTASQRFSVTLAVDAPLSTRPYFIRPSISDNRYRLDDPAQFGRPASAAPAVAVARYQVAGVAVEAREVVRRREAKLPYGYEMRELRVVPALALTVSPSSAIIPIAAPVKRIDLQVEVVNNVEGGTSGSLALRLPTGWQSEPARHAFSFAHAGERAVDHFTVTVPVLDNRAYRVTAVASAGGREYIGGYDLLDHRDLETRYLYRPAVSDVRGVDVSVVPGLTIGYVMGIGDQVPAGIAQLGYPVTLLGESELAEGNLKRFDAIVTGTRAYAVREDLKTYNQRLLDEYVKAGGNLVVLYNTQEFVPDRFAPYPAKLPPQAEEVSEEDSPVDILAPDQQVFNWPNKISKADFDGWVEQRGSKFFSEWDAAYTPMIATWDKGQAPQKGGWVSARYGQGRYTYFAYAFHRQLPYGVPGAYRLLANVLALGKTPK
ncbi:MAG: GlcNAc-PI de-N-acetylase [Acidobacteria bacterium]|nr:MAG: GlcNAc-PI de-N-acetylase [Acidobacteriota bacterium]